MLGGDFEELPTACSALVGKHPPKLSVARTGDALPKAFGDGRLAIFGPDQPLILGHESPGEFVIAVLALIGKPLLESGNEMCSAPALRLGESMCGLT